VLDAVEMMLGNSFLDQFIAPPHSQPSMHQHHQLAIHLVKHHFSSLQSFHWRPLVTTANFGARISHAWIEPAAWPVDACAHAGASQY